MMEATRADPNVYTAGGVLRLEVPTYVKREADDQLFEEARRGQYCYILTSRQMGKSSLVVRAMERLGTVGTASVLIDISGMSSKATEEQWYTGHAGLIARALKLPASAMEWWAARQDLDPVQRFIWFLSDQVLDAIVTPVVIFIDEIDSTIERSFRDDYFAAIRALYHKRPVDARFERLTFVLVGVASPSDLIRDVQRTPFNIGKRIELTDFTREEARPLLQGLAPEPDMAEKLLDRVLFWTGGHPYLSQRACKVIAEWAQSDWNPFLVPAIVDDKIRATFLADESRRSDFNLQLVSDRLALHPEAPKLLAVYREVMRGAHVPDDDRDRLKMLLKLSGLVAPVHGALRVRNRIYQTVFDEAWIRSVLGDAPEPERQIEYDAFISYSLRDREFVAGFLAPRLKLAGLKVASDIDLPPGVNWRERLPRMRESSRFFVPVLSPDWLTSRGAQEEFELMSNRVGAIVPVLLRPTRLPAFLASIQWADFTDPAKWPQSIASLIAVLGGQPSAAIAEPAAAARTADSGRVFSELITRYTRDGLLQLVSERFRPLLDRIEPQMSGEGIAAIVLDYARAYNRLEELSDLIAESARPPAPVQPLGAGYHAFVAMPFGRKNNIDFNAVYHQLIRPALEEAGFEVFRQDEIVQTPVEPASLQELLIADVVVVDLTLEDANVWYQAGVRHALRGRGVIQTQAFGEDRTRFEGFGVSSTFRYRLLDGAPAAEYLDASRKALAALAREAAGAKQFVSSPVRQLAPHLKEPVFEELRVQEADLWARWEEWQRRIDLAKTLVRPGDILVLADEAPVRTMQAAALRTSAQCLQSLGEYETGMVQCERALKLDPENLQSRLLRALLLNRLGRFEEARDQMEKVLRDHPDDGETWGLMGRLHKEAWLAAWRQEDVNPREEAAAGARLLEQAYTAYENGFVREPGNYYPGINALAMLSLAEHLRPDFSMGSRRAEIEGGIRWALRGKLDSDPEDYWARLTLAELALLSGDEAAVERLYEQAAASAGQNWFALDSARQQLAIYLELGFREATAQAAMDVVDRAITGLHGPVEVFEPRQVILFSGHMIDAPGRKAPRFPADQERVAETAIESALDELGSSVGDLGLCGGANGGDLLFAEACLRRGVRVELRLPLDEPRFLRESVTPAGDTWRDRYYAVKAHKNTTVFEMPKELGPAPGSVNPYARNNQWQLYTALSYGDERLRFVCLWNGAPGDGPGGAQHMMDAARSHTDRVYWLNTNELFHLAAT